jgi:hypothetical protein
MRFTQDEKYAQDKKYVRNFIIQIVAATALF